MFKWPGSPSPQASEHELADFAELLCWKRGYTSKTELTQILSRLDDVDYSDDISEEYDGSGGVLEEDETPIVVSEAFGEIERRNEACRGRYAFIVDEAGDTLLAKSQSGDKKEIIYKYLLLATRLNMSNNRVHAGIDGSLLLEELSAEAARQYLGARAESTVFGTADGASDFPGKVNDLCTRLGEGGGFTEHGGSSRYKKDDKLDVVAWKPFADRREGKLIAFGQCKTGTNWKDQVSQLQPDAFCSKWLQSRPVLVPVRMFFISEALSSVNWRNESINAGLLFDRCRIVDFCDEISQDVLRKIASWTKAAAQATDLPGL